MKKLTIITICLAAFVVAALAADYDESNFSSGGRMYQPAPEGYIIGKDNAPGRGVHHPGENCGMCHCVGGRAESHLFTMAGTLYKDRSGSSVLKRGEVIMEDRDGNVISMTSNRAGNFWTTTPIASDPYTVSSTHGHEPFIPMYEEDEKGNLVSPADPDNPRTWLYKTWVRKGNSVRPMLTIAAVAGGSAWNNRMSCNMHHGGVGSGRGAVRVGKGPTLPSYPASDLSYRKHIYPILRSKCGCCHIPGKTMTSVKTKTDLPGDDSTSIDISGELDLMTYDGSTEKKGVIDVVDPDDPEESLLLLKTVSGGDLHAGGVFWNERNPDYIAIRQWIAEGAPEE